jgi:hypothetical protein
MRAESAHVPGWRLRLSPRERPRLDLHMDEEWRQAGRTQAATKEGGVVDLIIIALLVLEVVLERLL